MSIISRSSNSTYTILSYMARRIWGRVLTRCEYGYMIRVHADDQWLRIMKYATRSRPSSMAHVDTGRMIRMLFMLGSDSKRSGY